MKAKGTIDWLLQQLVSRPLGKIEPMILNILRLGVFQIYFLERIPASAACNESVNLAKKFGHEGIVKFVNGVLRGAVRSKESIVYPDAGKDPRQYLALKERAMFEEMELKKNELIIVNQHIKTILNLL